MDNRRIAASVVISLTLLSGIVALTMNQGETVKTSKNSGENFSVTDSGVRYTVHPDRLISGCRGMDCIPSIDNPEFRSASEVEWLAGSDLVIGIERNGTAKAYPLRILNLHEIVNDEIAGEPVAVTYCPLCRSGLAYSRQVGNRTLEFGVSGKLYNANLVMYDRQTETYWSQIKGEAIVGPLVPEKLDLVSSQITEWEGWRKENPGSLVLSRNTGIYPASSYGSSPYTGYQSSESVGFGVDEVDDRLPSKELVYGIAIGGEAKAYTEEKIRREDLIQDTVGGIPVVLVEDQASGGIKAFMRRKGNRTLNLTLKNGRIVDQEGELWRFSGEKSSGNEKLPEIGTHGIYWFAWSKFHPETSVYGVK
ncbi:MAG: DUF3179 domain-containing protein [Candidatus Nanosalina sp.]